MDNTQRFQAYLGALKKPFIKRCRLRFLQPDGTTAFALDNNPDNERSGAFIQDGEISCNDQNGQRRTATVTLSNLDGEYDFNINKVWFGQQIALDEGLVLPDGSDFYIQQGVFYIQDPTETLEPGQRTVEYSLVDKWAYLDGTLFGNLEGTYEVPVDSNIFDALRSLLLLPRGNGYPVDSVEPIITQYYNGKTQEVTDRGDVLLTNSPYTLRIDSDSGTYADVAEGLADMLAARIGYDASGALRLEPSQDDILDTDKPVLWAFSTSEAQLLGATYTTNNSSVYNDYIVIGETLDDGTTIAARATNKDPMSDTNIYTSLGRRTVREAASGYYTTRQCEDLAVWRLKRATTLQKSVSVSCTQMFHLEENNLISLTRTDKQGSPTERHLITGFSRPLASSDSMTIECTSVNDYPSATVEQWPLTNS